MATIFCSVKLDPLMTLIHSTYNIYLVLPSHCPEVRIVPVRQYTNENPNAPAAIAIIKK